MKNEIIIADPAKNITVFVLNDVENRVEAAKHLLCDPSLRAEQVGFVIPPKEPHEFWRLEMMGGEFCANASRSFALFVARKIGLSGNADVMIETSGMKNPLKVKVNVETGNAEIDITKPTAVTSLDFNGITVPVYIFDGITHIIAAGINAEKEIFFSLKTLLEKNMKSPQALGVMFYDKSKDLMIPAVYVYETETLIFESSCGSGSAALGLWKNEKLNDGEGFCSVNQKGGIIEVKVTKSNGTVTSLSIGGTVSLSKKMFIE